MKDQVSDGRRTSGTDSFFRFGLFGQGGGSGGIRSRFLIKHQFVQFPEDQGALGADLLRGEAGDGEECEKGPHRPCGAKTGAQTFQAPGGFEGIVEGRFEGGDTSEDIGFEPRRVGGRALRRRFEGGARRNADDGNAGKLRLRNTVRRRTRARKRLCEPEEGRAGAVWVPAFAGMAGK